jgi:hypothetical protein
MTFFPLVSIRCFTNNKHKVMMHSSNHKEHYRKKLYYLTCTKHNCTSVHPIFNRTTSITGHKQRDSQICWCQQLPRSTANCSVNFTTGITLTRTATKPTYSFANFK